MNRVSLLFISLSSRYYLGHMPRPRTRTVTLSPDVRRQLIELFGNARNVHRHLALDDLGFQLHHVRQALLPNRTLPKAVREQITERWDAWRKRYLRDERTEYFTFKIDPEALPPVGDPDHDRRLRNPDDYPDPDQYL